MTMEAQPSRGFHRILSRLDDATRNHYCAEALQDEVVDVRQQFQLCTQAMDHAKQVDEATKSLIANAATAISVSSPAVTQLLAELGGLQATFQQSINKLTAHAQVGQQGAGQQPEVVTEQEPEKGEEVKLLEKLHSILTKQRRSSWLNEAIETARAAVRVMRESPIATAPDAPYSPNDARIYDAFKLLRKSLLENTATHADQLPLLRKMLKKIAKKRPSVAVFTERSDEIITMKEKKLTEKKQSKAQSSEADDGKTAASTTKSKKRRLSETSVSTEKSTAAAVANTASSKEQPVVRSKYRKCAAQAKSLGDLFTLEAYDACLTVAVDIVNKLSSQLSGAEVELVSSTLFRLVEKAEKIKDPERRLDRLVCLEGLLSVLVKHDGLVWDSTRTQVKAHEYHTNCLYLMEALRSSLPSVAARAASSKGKHRSSPSVAAPPANKKKKSSGGGPGALHMRFE